MANYQREAIIRTIRGLMSACRLTANRPDILALWVAGSFDDMPDNDLVECRSFMELAYRCKTTLPPEPIRRLRSQALTLLNRIGRYATPDDWTEVNRFLLQRKVCGRLLYMLSESELMALIRKLRAIADKSPAPAGDPPPSGPKEPKMFTMLINTGQSIIN